MAYHDILFHLLFPPIPIPYTFPSHSHSHSSPLLIRHSVLTLILEIPKVIPTLSPQFRCTYSPGYRALYPHLSSHLPCMSCSSSCLCPLSLPTPFVSLSLHNILLSHSLITHTLLIPVHVLLFVWLFHAIPSSHPLPLISQSLLVLSFLPDTLIILFMSSRHITLALNIHIIFPVWLSHYHVVYAHPHSLVGSLTLRTCLPSCSRTVQSWNKVSGICWWVLSSTHES